MFNGQFGTQPFLLIMTLMWVSWLPCAKPFLLYHANKQKQLVTMVTMVTVCAVLTEEILKMVDGSRGGTVVMIAMTFFSRYLREKKNIRQ